MLQKLLSEFRDLAGLFHGHGFNNPYLIQNSKGIGLDVDKYLKSPEGREAFAEAGKAVKRERDCGGRS